jgi:hypothetical protein
MVWQFERQQNIQLRRPHLASLLINEIAIGVIREQKVGDLDTKKDPQYDGTKIKELQASFISFKYLQKLQEATK